MAGEELGYAIGEELPPYSVVSETSGNVYTAYTPEKSGVLFGVAIPTALLAMIPAIGVLSGAFCLRREAGVPAADGVLPLKKRGLGLPSDDGRGAVASSISASSDGKLISGGEDMLDTR